MTPMKLPGTFREILSGLRRTYPPQKRAADYAMSLVSGAVYRPLSLLAAALLIRLGVGANHVTYFRYCAVAAECLAFALEHDELELAAPAQPVGDLEPGGPGAAVDEDRRGHQAAGSSRSSRT